MNILVTGGTGYIGSHTVLELLENDHEVVVIDNLSNSSTESIKRVEKLTNKKVPVHIFDISDKAALQKVFTDNHFDAVIHFAGFKAVDESVADPLLYYRNNLFSTIVLCEVMAEHNVRQLVFSSSCTVYGSPKNVPVTEKSDIHATNPYGQTKVISEQILQDLALTRTGWQISLLRYFNPVGAHKSGDIGEDPNGTPNNLLPFVAQVVIGRRPIVKVFGNDYDTVDGTGVRDYIHVVDLAKGHLAALLHPPKADTAETYNLGYGKGYSVLQVIAAFEKASGKKVPYEIVGRRPGDIAACFADPAKSQRGLHWQAELTLADACADTWRWQSQNPNGYAP